ncbi:LemA family protein [Periweissella beninensis]|uniref:LemA family protein n=1 Tax=Periweissella beninensis TaxID=504936 RepID=A0ABT0VFL2_9LACO|nr:LemA family protein [Periweissella beninensis]MBM7543653.1 LemA protein [Periweissella beninensis]MCM2436632.1 LemA family protein [Periweissella beninensis]MCT4395602.1 LemA family protein [Periweissella beninensis]
MSIIITIIIIAVLIFMWISIYNGLVRTRMNTQETWSQIDVQLKRRNDLIPNLVETVKGYANFEQGTLEKVIGLRNQIAQVPNANHDEKMELSDQLSSSLKGIFAVAEAYPDLKANVQYSQLMEELTNTENKISYSRQLFNSSTANYNGKLQSFPTNIVAKVHHFEPSEFLETPTAEKEVPKVSFGPDGK